MIDVLVCYGSDLWSLVDVEDVECDLLCCDFGLFGFVVIVGCCYCYDMLFGIFEVGGLVED